MTGNPLDWSRLRFFIDDHFVMAPQAAVDDYLAVADHGSAEYADEDAALGAQHRFHEALSPATV
ncbi:MAG TPA: hypothetical protein VEA41_09100, partial [Salinarimonas sp.]|nr:hypothetical protein [Salinarimonas sp.]